MSFCLLPTQVDAFKAKLIDGTINPEKLSSMTSEERHALLSTVVGESNATQVNSLFESKLLLKDQQAGFIRWATKTMDISAPVRRDLISKINNMDKVLTTASTDNFLKDLAATKLGVAVTAEEAKTISDLSTRIADAKTKMNADFTFASEADRLNYGSSQALLIKYVGDLKSTVTQRTIVDYLKNPVKSVAELSGVAKAVKASLDNSFFGRQGLKTLMTHPIVWVDNFAKSWVDIAKTTFSKSTSETFLGKLTNQGVGDNVKLAIDAEVLSRPNALNGNYVRAKLALGVMEEAYPSSLPEKIPLLGRLFKASEVAYNGAATRLRADLADQLIAIAEKQGRDLSKNIEIESIGHLVNSLTGRGNLGSLEGAGKLTNAAFFSIKYAKSNWDVLTAHQTSGTRLSTFAQKQAAYNLIKIVGATAGIMTIANKLYPGSAELDPRSSDFGKIRIGDTRFDISGGMSSIVTLASRIIMQSSKSTTSKEVKPLGTGFNQTSGMDLFWSFMENKLSPLAQVAKDLVNQADFNGNRPSILSELANFGLPLPITNFNELKSNPNAANVLLGTIADALGITTNTYSAGNKKINPLFDTRTKLEKIIGLPPKVNPQEQAYNQAKVNAKTAADEVNKAYIAMASQPDYASRNEYFHKLQDTNPELAKSVGAKYTAEQKKSTVAHSEYGSVLSTLSTNQAKAEYLFSQIKDKPYDEANSAIKQLWTGGVISQDTYDKLAELWKNKGSSSSGTPINNMSATVKSNLNTDPNWYDKEISKRYDIGPIPNTFTPTTPTVVTPIPNYSHPKVTPKKTNYTRDKLRSLSRSA